MIPHHKRGCHYNCVFNSKHTAAFHKMIFDDIFLLKERIITPVCQDNDVFGTVLYLVKAFISALMRQLENTKSLPNLLQIAHTMAVFTKAVSQLNRGKVLH